MKEEAAEIKFTMKEKLSYYLPCISKHSKRVKHILEEGMSKISNELDILALLKDLRNLKRITNYETLELQEFHIIEIDCKAKKNTEQLKSQ